MSTKGELYFPINAEVTDPRQGSVYVLKKIIGRGAYAQCFLAMVGEEPFALKIVKLADLKSDKVRQKLETEITIHGSLDHANIVKMYTSFRNSQYIFMVLELCERGALDDLLRRNGRLKERYVAKFMLQIVKALAYLHNERSVVHRDLKLGNLFLDTHLNIKVGDFGLSAQITGNEKRRTVCGTPNYIAPEILFGKATGHSFEADIWSLGVILYTLLIGTPPFQQKKVEEIYRLIEKNQYIFPPDNSLSSEAIDLISRLLTTNPNERPELAQILGHRFLSQKENLAYRVYRNLFTGGYRVGGVDLEHVVFSIPISAVAGVGYILRSGVCGIYYQNMTNAYLRPGSLVFVKLKVENERKVFVTEEHMLGSIPECLAGVYSNVAYFARHYSAGQRWARGGLLGAENAANARPGLQAQGAHTSQNIFVAKIKKIKDGILFIMTNNVFIFDFNDGSRVVVASEGTHVFAFSDDGPVEFSERLKEACTAVLKIYCNSR
ncbi:polo-like kinase 1 [Pancytospora philotis]|nr:polo-like kinase 1 [Pancytospora philotis]